MSRTRHYAAALAALALAAPALALAQDAFPARTVRIMVGANAGGGTDIIARMLGEKFAETFKQPFVVENRPGGDGYIGFEAVARADPDGYTLVYAPGSTMMIAPHLVKRADFDPIKVLTPAAATGSVSLYVMVKLDLPVNNYQEFLAYARANPGKLNYGTPGNGTSPHIAVEVYNREAKVKLNHIPYKGAGPALKDLLGGVIDLTFDPGVGLPQAKSGKLRLIAIAGPKRHADFPDVPTLEENGIKGVDGGPYFGFYAPNGTPPALLDRLNREVQKVMQEPVVADRFRTLAVDVAPPMTPEAFAAYVRSEYARYGKLLKELGIEQ